MPSGTWSDISTCAAQEDDKAVKHKSQARSATTTATSGRPDSAHGQTKSAAERALLKKLQDRARTGRRSGERIAMQKMNDLIDLLEEKFQDAAKDSKPSTTTTLRRIATTPGSSSDTGSQSSVHMADDGGDGLPGRLMRVASIGRRPKKMLC